MQHQDQLFSQLFIHGREKELTRGLNVLPDEQDLQTLDQVATTLGRKATAGNPFGIQKKFYEQRILPNQAN